MRNWPQTVPGASFRGFPFEVEREGGGGAGRFVAVHTYAGAETHDTEDTGRKPHRFRVTAYIVGDDADDAADRFIAECSAGGIGDLILPVTAPQRVRCCECSWNSDKTQQGKVALDLEFVEAGGVGDGSGSGYPAIPIGDRLAADALDTLAGVVSDAINAFVPDPVAGFLPPF
ncbi:hypothetical protein MFUR16E_04750 [Methylobacterium fujisawaense]|uniref:DNA circularization N-terminal domain-containing protein n=1 Tax=Methylobacterium fujisawaense TaxID=107400 RepID=UPI002F2FE96F